MEKGKGTRAVLTLKHRVACAVVAASLSLAVAACGGSPSQASASESSSDAAQAVGILGGGKEDAGTTSGAPFSPASAPLLAPSALTAADATDVGTIDATTAQDGYVTVAVLSEERIKFQVICGEMSYNYDVAGDGTPLTVPLNMGDGAYTFRVMQNTSGSNYVELSAESAEVKLASEFEPFLRPNAIVRYDASSACVKKASELVSGAANQGDALSAVCTYVIGNVTYDKDKAAQVANASGYLPNPDDTLATGKGICFDYSALGAAMLRSQGIPTRLMTGYVSPEDVYHAWICVYIDGTWQTVQFDVRAKTWERLDLTFAAGASKGLVGDGKEYTDRYTY